MVEYYFDNKDKQIQLKKIMDEWEGTPYKHHIGVKGMGCDCIHLVARVLGEFGLLPLNLKLPDYPRDWHFHNTRELLIEEIKKHLNIDIIDISNKFINGDIILSHYGKAASHAGIYFDGYIYQSLDGIGVRKININDDLNKKIRFICRIIK